MTITTTKPNYSQPASEKAVDLFDNWFIRSRPRCALGRVSSSKN